MPRSRKNEADIIHEKRMEYDRLKALSRAKKEKDDVKMNWRKLVRTHQKNVGQTFRSRQQDDRNTSKRYLYADTEKGRAAYFALQGKKGKMADLNGFDVKGGKMLKYDKNMTRKRDLRKELGIQKKS